MRWLQRWNGDWYPGDYSKPKKEQEEEKKEEFIKEEEFKV